MKVPDGSKIEQFKQLIEMDPNDPVLHYGLGMEYQKLGDFVAAAEEFRRTTELNPDYSAAYRESGKVLEKLGQNQEAARTYRKGIEVSKQNGDLQTMKEIEVFLRRLAVG